MPITEAQRRERQRYLCASDSPVILGLSPYRRTPSDIYFSKVYDLPLEDDDRTTEAQNTGNLLEDPLLDWAAKELGGVQLHKQPWFICDEGPAAGVFAAHPDAVIAGKAEGLEAKYCNAAMGQGYGEQGTDAIPDHVVIQAAHQMLAGKLDRVWIPVALAGFALEFKLFCVSRDEELIDMIVTRGMEWWNRHVVGRVPPDGDCPPPMEILKRVRREPESCIELPEDALRLVFAWEQAKFREKEAKEEKEELQAKIIDLLDVAEAGTLADGRMVTYLEQKSPPVTNTKLLRADHPDLYEQYVKQGTHRSLRVKEPKRGKGDGIKRIMAEIA